MSDCVGAPRMPVCRENYPFVCSTIKSPDNVPIEFAIENGASVRIVFLNYQSQKHKHQRSRSRQLVFTALLDNDRDNRVAAQRREVSGADDKIGGNHPRERCFRKRKPRLRFIALLYSRFPFRAVLPRHQEAAECDGGL